MIKEYIAKAIHHWRILLEDKAFVISLIVGNIVFWGATAFQMSVSAFLDESIQPSMQDRLLDLLPTLNLNFFFVYVFFSLIVLVAAYTIIVRPEKMPFLLKTYGILILTRTAFIVLTEVGPPVGVDPVFVSNSFEEFFFRNDLFFSGHTAVPFVAYLLYKDVWLGKVMLVGSIVMAATVLLMHVHYSIDVFAAPFIAYGVYSFSDEVFNHLNLRFHKRIKFYGWRTLKKKIQGPFHK